jgi:hypothetical protein
MDMTNLSKGVPMHINWYRIIFIVCLILLTACSPPTNPGGTVTPSPEKTPEDPEPTPKGEDPTAVPTPTEVAKWDDLSIFEQTLTQAGQDSLDNLPPSNGYHLSLIIPENLTEPLTGSLEVRYVNLEINPVDEVYFRLFPNYYGGVLSVEQVEVDGLPAETSLESDGTALRVDLPDWLNPGWEVEISMDYELVLPETMGGNYGLLGYFDDVLVLDTFYPMIPAYDQDGWYSDYPYPNGDLTYQDASFYLVEVSAPADLVIAASGSVVEETVENGMQHLTIASGPARDFYLAASTSFTVSSKEWDGVLVSSYALEGLQKHQDAALDFAIQALETFSDLFGPYPYREFDLVSTPMQALGIEYPGIAGFFLDLYQEGESTRGLPNLTLLETVVAHEVGHQWFYNVVGSDQQNQPWVDEGLVQYITYVYFLQNYGASAAQELSDSWTQRLESSTDPSLAVGLPAGAYSPGDYSGIIYGKSPMFYQTLEESLGQEMLWEAISVYYQIQYWQLADTETLKASLEFGCGCDLTLLFEIWIYPGAE